MDPCTVTGSSATDPRLAMPPLEDCPPSLASAAPVICSVYCLHEHVQIVISPFRSCLLSDVSSPCPLLLLWSHNVDDAVCIRHPSSPSSCEYCRPASRPFRPGRCLPLHTCSWFRPLLWRLRYHSLSSRLMAILLVCSWYWCSHVCVHFLSTHADAPMNIRNASVGFVCAAGTCAFGRKRLGAPDRLGFVPGLKALKFDS